MTPFQGEMPSKQRTAEIDGPCEGYLCSETNEAGLSSVTNYDGINLRARMNEGVGHTMPTSPSQVVMGNDRPDVTSDWKWSHTNQCINGEGLENSSLSQREHLLKERYNHASGWHCPICNQRLKRRDYIKPHVKRKHPENYGGLDCTPISTSETSIAASANFSSTHGDHLASELLGVGERSPLMVSWDRSLDIQTPKSFRSEFAFRGGNITPQKRSFDNISPDGRDVLDGSKSEPSSRLKTNHGSWTRSLACPFYKHYPFQHRKCLALSLQRPKDVKQHIYRSHIKPEFYCARCYYIFHSATERDTHWREKLCDRLESPVLLQFQGITNEQRKLLNEKSPRELDVEAQWFQIYRIIFPGSELPRSAYVGNCLEEIVPLLRKKWATQGYKIMARAVGDLSLAMDLFFRILEGEAFEHETDDNSICAVPRQSQIEDSSQWCTGSNSAM